MRYLATTGLGIEGILKNEIMLLGMMVEQVAPGYVVYEGSDDGFILSNLSLRTADRVFLLLDEFQAETFDELFDALVVYPFEDLLGEEAEIIVNAKSYRSELFSLRNIQQIAKKAIVTRLGRVYQRTVLPETGPSYPIMIRIDHNRVRVLLDTSGEPLHRRGYRISGKLAPIRENLAASLVLMSRFFGKGPFIDPMCGSGTIAIEAAMIARDIPPGHRRRFIFEDWFETNRSDIQAELMSRVKPTAEFSIQGFDIDPAAIRLAIKNAKAAGVYQDIELAQADVKDFTTEQIGGTIVTNAPYGARMGSDKEVAELEAALVERLLTQDTFRLGLLLGNQSFSRGLKRRPNKVRKLYNGRLVTYFYQFEPTRKW